MKNPYFSLKIIIRVFRADSQNSNYDFKGKLLKCLYTFLFDDYIPIINALQNPAPGLPRIASLLIRGGVLFILQEC